METIMMILVILLLVAVLASFLIVLILALGGNIRRDVDNIYEAEYRKNRSTTNNVK